MQEESDIEGSTDDDSDDEFVPLSSSLSSSSEEEPEEDDEVKEDIRSAKVKDLEKNTTQVSDTFEFKDMNVEVDSHGNPSM